jgi:hypothetical protein
MAAGSPRRRARRRGQRRRRRAGARRVGGRQSALVHHFLDGIEQRRGAVLAARCYERETVPYKAVDRVMEVLAHRLAALPPDVAAALLPPQMAQVVGTFPVFLQVPAVAASIQIASAGRADPFGQRIAMFGAVRELFSRLAGRDRLVVAIDDLQWADRDSLALLAELMAPPAPPLLLCVTVRASGEAAAGVLGALATRLGDAVRRLPVTDLSPGAARELVEQLVRSAGARRGGIHAADSPRGRRSSHADRRAGPPSPAAPRRRGAGPARRRDRRAHRRSRGDARRVLQFLCVAGGPSSRRHVPTPPGSRSASSSRCSRPCVRSTWPAPTASGAPTPPSPTTIGYARR